METMSIEERLAKVIQLQKQADDLYNSIKTDHPEAWRVLELVEAARQSAETEKQAVKDELVKKNDFDTHQVEGYNISVSRTVRLSVVDKDKVNARYIKQEEVVDLKTAQEDMLVTGVLPYGFEDKSFYRLNWKEVKNA